MSYVKTNVPIRDKAKNTNFKAIIKVSFVILVSMTAIIGNTLLVHLSRWSISSKDFLKSMHCYGTSREHCVYQEISKFDLVSTIVFEVNNIFRVIGFLWNGPIELIKQKSQIFLYYCQILYYEREFFETGWSLYL